MDKQDIILGDISQEVTKLKHFAILIGTDVDEHNALLDETHTTVAETNLKLDNTNKKIDRIIKLSKDKYCLFISILLIILVILIVIYFS